MVQFPPTTHFLTFNKEGEHWHYGDTHYCLDKLIDRLRTKPRPVSSLLLNGWFTQRRQFEGRLQSFLISPENEEHLYVPTNLPQPMKFPILICIRKGTGEVIIDGIHRTVTALRRKKLSIPCILITEKELEKVRHR